MSRYLVVIEQGPSSYGAWVPDLPGCAAVGRSADEVRQLIREAVAMHVQGLHRQGVPVPEPQSEAAWAESA
jgi:predicted RNase H-like HicB family nuclease